MLLNHTGLMLAAATETPDLPFIELAITDRISDSLSWKPVSFFEFKEDCYRIAHFFRKKLLGAGVVQGDVVALWVSGTSYVDILQLMVIIICGYTPQLLAVGGNSAQVDDLVKSTNCKAIIVAPEFASLVGNLTYQVSVLSGLENLEQNLLTDKIEASGEETSAFPEVQLSDTGIAAILHTTSTTSSRPKIIPITYQWQESVINGMKDIAPSKTKVAALWAGSICHASGYLLLFSSLRFRAMMVQAYEKPLSSAGLVCMTQKTSLNRVLTYGTFLEDWIRDARANTTVLKAMQDLPMIRYTGMGIGDADADWALKHGICLSSNFVSTEAGLMLYSIPNGTQEGQYLRELPSNPMIFSKVDAHYSKPDGTISELFELIVPGTSPSAPVPSLRDSNDNFRTDDLFEEVSPQLYTYRGRADNFFKDANADWVPAGVLEESLKTRSPSIVANAVVVGLRRPYTVFLIEPVDARILSLTSEEQLKVKLQIIADQKESNAGRYEQEKIDMPDRIVFIQPGRLPRTPVKGSLQHGAIEIVFKEELGVLYSSIAENA